MRRFDESLRFKTFTSMSKTSKVSKANEHLIKSSTRANTKFYCADYNRGTCTFTESHEGKLNRMLILKRHMCKACWEREGMERKHPEGHRDCKFTRV